jgi:hypothetical protein
LPPLPVGSCAKHTENIQGILSFTSERCFIMMKQVFGLAIVAACAEAFAFGPAISFVGRYV